MAAPLSRKFDRVQTLLKSCPLFRSRLNTYSKFTSAISLQRLKLTNTQKAGNVEIKHIAPRLQSCRFYTETAEQADVDGETDELYRQIVVEVKGHDPSVMQSYKTFVTQAAKELDVNIQNIETPPKKIVRRTLLKSVFIYSRHRSQFEMRTHFNVYTFKHLTGSTADTFLEYIQRNLPEGMAMKVTKHRLEQFQEHLKAPSKDQANTES